MPLISIRGLTDEDCRQLAAMLCEDDILRRDLGIPEDRKSTAEAFARFICEWERERNASTYAIVLDGDTAVGTISLSHVDLVERSGRIGYWVGSDYRKKGHCTEAFGRVVEEAVSRGLERVRASIAEENIPSRRIWERHGGRVVCCEDGKIAYEIELDGKPS